MKILCGLFLCLVLTGFGFAQETKSIKDLQLQAKSFKNGKRFEVNYDKFENRTVTIFSPGFNMLSFGEYFASTMASSRPNAGSILEFGAGFGFPTDTLKGEPETYFLYFSYKGSEWLFLKNSKLIALADGERIQFGEPYADRDVKSKVEEFIAYQISKEDLEKLAKAKSLEMKIGSLQRKFKPEHTQMFADLLELADVSNKTTK